MLTENKSGMHLVTTDHISGEGNAISHVHLSVSILAFEPADFFACVWAMTIAG